ncbi:MAG TPA: D-xylose ABC transporter substrate-binding protein [Thermoanaerobaculia bacterium]|jgi:D-xylose transport system substrate-binding protein|nr:D-xylose ABC transporter substrate-binding protein [Thermoanaerobaculia bacterium]
MQRRSLFLILAVLVVLTACGRGGTAKQGGRQLTIGLSLDTLREERWQRDRDLFVARAQALGARVLVQAANNNEVVQNAQAENLLTQGVDVLVVAPHNSKTAATIVESAHRTGVPVIAYDRLINDSDVDLYISFDNERVGELQAGYAVQRAPRGRYVLIGGSPADNNALLFHQGQMNVLKPFVERHEIEIVTDQYAADWQPVQALKIMENALTRNDNHVDAVVASNDGLAGGAIQALAEQGLAGKIVVTGQDAELSACQRIVSEPGGTQSMTVYKPIRTLAGKAAEIAVAMGRKQPYEKPAAFVDNGFKKVPSLLIAPVAVDKDNMVSTVIADGFHSLEQVYAGIPRERWPKR